MNLFDNGQNIIAHMQFYKCFVQFFVIFLANMQFQGYIIINGDIKRHCSIFCENFFKSIKNTILFIRYGLATYTKRLIRARRMHP